MDSATMTSADQHEVVGVRELRDGLSRYLARVREGTEITVTDHGKPIARLVPTSNAAYERLVASGRLVHPDADAPPLPTPRRLPPLSDLIER